VGYFSLMKNENLVKTYERVDGTAQVRPETATRSVILYLFGQGKPYFYLGKVKNFEK